MSVVGGVIFDFDGVLVSTDKATLDFYRDELLRKGITLTEEHFSKKVGRKSEDFFRETFPDKFHAIDVKGMVERKRQAFESDPTRYAEEITGAGSLVKRLHDAGIRLAIASGNGRRMVEETLSEMGLSKYFDSIVAWEDVIRKKPHPEAYDLAARNLGLDKSECVVIEDSDSGIRGSKSGGFITLAPQTEHNRQTIGLADESVGSLDEITPEMIRGLIAGRTGGEP